MLLQEFGGAFMRQADYATMRIRIPLDEFGRYLRTGWWIGTNSSGPDVEVKFNPWHDSATGRFTSKGASDGYWNGGGFTGGGGGSFGGVAHLEVGKIPLGQNHITIR
jgi:hypothetical protein